MKVRTRMAPSPTGEYHVGHIRTLLYNWAYAKKMKGDFLLRIEDTDRTRFIEGATERIMDVIKAYGFSWDEGPDIGGPFAPYIQSERLALYKKYADELVANGHAYPCFCTSERLAQMREDQQKKCVPSTKYDRHCLSLSEEEIKEKLANNEPHVIRQKMPDSKVIEFTDVVYGKITYNSQDLDDQVLLKSDGFPTYQLAVVIDDHLMEITHVMRGNDWLPSTPKHILLYEAFGWDPPVHIHLPNLKELGGTKKLSKRFGPVSAREFLDEGYLPEAIVNFLMLLGWNPGTKEEIFSVDEFIQKFDPKDITKTDLVAFDRNKLEWMNGQYIQKLSDREFAKKARSFVPKEVSDETLERVAPLVKTRIKKFSELVKLGGPLLNPQLKPEPLPISNYYTQNISGATLSTIQDIPEWTLENVNSALEKSRDTAGTTPSDFYGDMRGTVFGSKVTPPVNDSIYILGKEKTVEQIKKGIDTIKKKDEEK